MKKLILIVLCLSITGCYSRVTLLDSLQQTQEAAQHEVKRFQLKRYDTKETAAIKLLQADREIIVLNNKLFVIKTQLNNLIEALREESWASRIINER